MFKSNGGEKTIYAFRATNTLIQFCHEHGYPEVGLVALIKCQDALEKKDFQTAKKLAEKIPLGTMGCFDDWIPSPLNHETENYARGVFEALVDRWSLILKGELPKNSMS